MKDREKSRVIEMIAKRHQEIYEDLDEHWKRSFRSELRTFEKSKPKGFKKRRKPYR